MNDDAPATFTRSVDLDVDLDAAWRLVGTAAGLASWLGDDVHVDLAPGGALRLRDDDGTTRAGTVTAVRPGRELAFRWAGPGDDASAVTIRVDEGDDGRARVTVTEVLASSGGRALACADAGAAWDARLLGLELGALVATPAFAALA
jgi:uncharacterized protein YndB with AHSA1/START domain